MFEKWKAWYQQYFKDDTHKKRKYMLIIAAIGLLFIITSNLFHSLGASKDIRSNADQSDKEVPEEVALSDNVEQLETQYETDLQTMLNLIQGVSETEVMVNVDATNEQIYEKDLIIGTQTTEELDKNGGERKVEDSSEEKKVVFVKNGNEEVPVLVQTKKPNIRGVFVIAKGAERAEVKKSITEAVSRVLDVPTHKISVMPK